MTAERIWTDVYHALENFVKSQVRDNDAVQDILQDVFVKLQTGLPRVNQQEKVTAWLFQIARNAIADYFRQQKRFMELPVLEQETEPQLTGEDLTREFAQCIPGMLNVLPEKYRQALYLSEIEGLSQKELAERLRISYPGARSRVQRGRQMLRKVLLQCCLISTDVYGNIIDYEQNPNRKK